MKDWKERRREKQQKTLSYATITLTKNGTKPAKNNNNKTPHRKKHTYTKKNLAAFRYIELNL